MSFSGGMNTVGAPNRLCRFVVPLDGCRQQWYSTASVVERGAVVVALERFPHGDQILEHGVYQEPTRLGVLGHRNLPLLLACQPECGVDGRVREKFGDRRGVESARAVRFERPCLPVSQQCRLGEPLQRLRDGGSSLEELDELLAQRRELGRRRRETDGVDTHAIVAERAR
ncbi:hypothetical protein [Haloparvum sp. PAK95]|uniref:hypothetical protein n=1 Tax=Haloparvum sp. PAK95 TaxID=3418962 RepID=UPI003D2EA92C